MAEEEIKKPVEGEVNSIQKEQATLDAEQATKGKEHPDDLIARSNAAAKLNNEAAERMEKANAERARILVEEKLSGVAEAGKPNDPPKKEETAVEYTERVMRGDYHGTEK